MVSNIEQLSVLYFTSEKDCNVLYQKPMHELQSEYTYHNIQQTCGANAIS